LPRARTTTGKLLPWIVLTVILGQRSAGLTTADVPPQHEAYAAP
jgi:hypothetical protein